MKQSYKVGNEKMFLEDLPRWSIGKNKGGFNWNKTIKTKVKFIYKDIEGWLEILDYKSPYLYVK